MTTWASRIDDLQETAGLTLAEIAEQIGVAPSTVGDLKTGRSASPRGEAALKLDALHRLRCAPKGAAA
jgi:transcriptional regulator with XRE-family HTH domain